MTDNPHGFTPINVSLGRRDWTDRDYVWACLELTRMVRESDIVLRNRNNFYGRSMRRAKAYGLNAHQRRRLLKTYQQHAAIAMVEAQSCATW